MTACMCCPAFRPRYKRLVDSIFPTTSDGGLVRSEMEKLTYYAVSAPEKLDRIGDYLAHRLTRDINRKRDASVFIAMEALDQLLMACHAQQINAFVESFLRMVANLLESDNLDFQAVGTNSFVKFSKIEEDMACYHRRYDFFVSKFSAMCHSNLKNTRDRKRLQGHGVRGLHGVVRKTVDDELQVNIWRKQHMDKIVPSLLYVMMVDQAQESPGRRESYQQLRDVVDNLGTTAEDCLRELLSRASYGNIGSALQPALFHLDSHKKWNPDNAFAIKCFKVFMYAIQTQYSHVIVKMLLDHLDQQDVEMGKLKASMLEVLCAVVVIPSSSPIGPAVIEVFNQLVRHLEYSTDARNQEEQCVFQSAFINTIGVLCDVLPGFQKLEAMVFFVIKAKEIMNKNDLLNQEFVNERAEKLLSLTLQNLYRIAENYTSKNLSGVSSSLIDPLLRVSSNCSSENRLIAQKVLIRLLDRSKNYDKLDIVKLVAGAEELDLTVTEAGIQDTDVVERKLPVILQFLFESSRLLDNTPENYTALYKCASMICIGLASPNILMDMCRVLLTLQDAAVYHQAPASLESELDGKSRTLIVNMIASCMCILAFVSNVRGLVQYVTGVMRSRLREEESYLDPTVTLMQPLSAVVPLPQKIDDSLLFSFKQIQTILKDSSGYKVERLNQPFVPTRFGEVESVQMKRSLMDADSVQIQMGAPPEDKPDSNVEKISAKTITFDYLKRKLMAPAPTPSDLEERKRKAAEHVLSSNFEQLVSEMQSRMPSSNQLFQMVQNAVSRQEGEITVLPFALPDECKPGTNNIVFPSICVL